MFFSPRANVVESDAGFSIQVLGRVGMIYRQGDRSVRIDSEVLATKGISIAKRSIRSWQPDGQAVSEEERATIINNIRDALAFKNEYLDVL